MTDVEDLERAARTIRLVLTVGACVLGAAGLLLLLFPTTFGSWLGLAGVDGATGWALRMVGACLIPLAAMMILVRRLRDHHAIGAALVMLVGSFLFTVLTITMPGGWTFLRTALLGAGLVFTGAYAVLLVMVRRAGG